MNYVRRFPQRSNLNRLANYQQFPLESLLRVNPDLLIVPKHQRHYPALAQQLLEHPAFSNVAHFYEIADEVDLKHSNPLKSFPHLRKKRSNRSPMKIVSFTGLAAGGLTSLALFLV